MTVTLDVLVLPAFDDLAGLPSEATPWEREFSLDQTIQVPGVPNPVRYAENGIGVVPTGVGKIAAATTTTALLSTERIDLSEALVCSVGVAGGPPRLPVGSVVLSETIIDWDDKCRFDGETEIPLAMNPYTENQGTFELDNTLVNKAASRAASVDIRPNREGASDENAAEPSLDEQPEIRTGTNLCGDELWHGRELAAQAVWLTEQYGCDSYCVTEMEDVGTASALARFDRLDQYLSIRGVSNHDRPAQGENSKESFFGEEFESGFTLGIENAVTVAQSVVTPRLG